MKKIVCFMGILLLVLCSAIPVFAEEEGNKEESYYWQQYEESGAADLPDQLPDDTRNALEEIGISGADWESIGNLSSDDIFAQIAEMTGEKSEAPLKAAISAIGIILICALLNSLKLSFGSRSMDGIISLVGTLCLCLMVVTPVIACIQSTADVIQGASTFLLACIPVMAGVMVAGGQTVSAGTYSTLMFGACNVISLIASYFIVPVLNIFLAVSISSANAPSLHLSGLCDSFYKVAKWVLGLCMAVFTGVLMIQTIISAAADGSGTKAAKFVLSSFVPVVGSALGEAFTTVQGCIRLLKSGVSAFTLLASAFIFLPVILQNVIWLLALHVCAGIGEIFELREMTTILKAAAKVVSMLLSIILCSIAILMISTVIMITLGGAVF